MAYNPTIYGNDTPPALNSSNLNKSEKELEKLSNSMGQWVFIKNYDSIQYPFIILDDTFSKVYFKLLAPTTGVTAIFIDGSNDNFQTFNRLYQTIRTEFTAEIASNYSAIRVTIALSSSGSGTFKAIIHGYDDYSISQKVLELSNDTDALQNNVSILNSVANNDIGQWIFESIYTSIQYPFIILDKVFTKVYFKLISPETGVTNVYIDGSNDGWSTFTRLYSGTDIEFTAEIESSGYTSLKVTIALSSTSTGTFKAIIHGYDDGTMSQEIVDLKENNKRINTYLDNLTVPNEKIEGTNNVGYYFANYAYTGIKSIANTDYNVRSYPVVAGQTYFLYGKNVSINASLPLAVFGDEAVSNNASYKTKILDGSSTPTDFSLRYTPEENGYIHIAWIINKVELGLYTTEIVSDAFIEEIGVNEKKQIKIQLFGDSITDNTWGDGITWANSISQMLSDYDVTIYNDAVAGACIGHGKAQGGGSHSHQEDEYNYVYDLVTDGETLQTSADYFVILVGTNDWAGGHDLGDMSSESVDTVYGALKSILEYISENTDGKVFVCTIPQRYNADDKNRDTNEYGEPINSDRVTLTEYCEPFKKLSAFYGMPCIDLNSSLGWNRINIDNFCYDGLHPNVIGDKMIAALITNEIKVHTSKE